MSKPWTPESDPDLTQTLQQLTTSLHTVSDSYQHQLEQQPLSTQRRLTAQTRQIFDNYREHGSRARLSCKIMKFLEGEMDVKEVIQERNDGSGRKMRVKVREELEVWPVLSTRTAGEGDDRDGPEDGGRSGDETEMGDVTVHQRNDADEMILDAGADEMDVDNDDNQNQGHNHDGFHKQSTPNHTTTTNNHASPTLSPQVTRPLRTNDLPSTGFISLPFEAVTSFLCIDEDTPLPSELVTILSPIFGLYNHLGSAMLRQLTVKYGPEPVFRVGVRELLGSRLEGLLNTARDDVLGLGPDVRTTLRAVFEGHKGSTGANNVGGMGAGSNGTVRAGELNDLEYRLLSQLTGTGRETIEEFAEDLNVRRRAWGGTCTVVARRELERMRGEKERRRRRGGIDAEDGWVVSGTEDSEQMNKE